MLCAADSSCFVTDTGLWYWVADWYKSCVLQKAVASAESPDCDTEWLIGIKFVCCRQQLLRYSQRIVYWVADWYKCCVLQTAVASLQSPDCDTEWLIGINVVCCSQQLLCYSHGIVILSGWLVYMLGSADSSCFVTVNRLWYWVADWYKCCVLQTAVASLQ